MENELLIAAIVAIVALVGLVILFAQGETSGAVVCGHMEMVQLEDGQYGLMCKSGPGPAAEDIWKAPVGETPYVTYTVQIHQPFPSVQQAQQRRYAIGQGGFDLAREKGVLK